MRRIVVVGLALVVCGLVILPMLPLGFIGDDVQTSWVPGYVAWWHVTVLQDVITNIESWLNSEGRFFPVSSFYAIYFFSTPLAWALEKPLQLLAVLVNALTLFMIVRRFSSQSLATLSLALFACTLQIRFWYDPIVAYFILLPVATESVLLSSLCLLIANDRRSWKWATMAIVSELIGLLTYEQTYSLFVAIAVAAYFAATDRRLKIFGPLIVGAPIAALTALDVALRSRVAHGAGDPYSIHLVPSLYFATFFKQVIGALPLSYWLFRPIPPAIPTFWALPTFIDAGVVVAAILTFLLVFTCLANDLTISNRSRSVALIVGFALWLFPAAVISLSPRWQAETIWGLAYLNVYIEYVGLALVLTVAVSSLIAWSRALSRRAIAVRTLVSAVLAVCIFITATVNRASSAAFVPIYTNGRINLDRSLRDGLLANVPDRSTMLFTDGSYLYPIPNIEYNVLQDSGIRVTPGNVDGIIAGTYCDAGRWTAPTCAAKPDIWEFKSATTSIDHPWVQLMHVRQFVRNAPGQPLSIGDRWSVYTDDLSGQHILDIGGSKLHHSGNSFGIYSYKSCAGLESFELVNTDFPDVVNLTGFYPTEHEVEDGLPHLFRWTLPEAELSVRKPPLPYVRADVQMLLRSLGTDRAMVRSGNHTVITTTSPAGTHIDIPVAFARDGKGQIQLSVRGGPFHVVGDPRTLGLQVSNIRVGFECPQP